MQPVNMQIHFYLLQISGRWRDSNRFIYFPIDHESLARWDMEMKNTNRVHYYLRLLVTDYATVQYSDPAPPSEY